MRTRFTGATLIDGTGAPARSDMTVEMENGTITAISADARSADLGPGVELVDARGLTLLPGLVDGHVHLLLRPDVSHPGDWERAQDDADAVLLLRAAAAAAQLLCGGVTTARDCGGRGDLPFVVRDAIANGVLPGPRILACGPVITRIGGHGHRFGMTADDAVGLRRVARDLLDRGADCLKIMATGGNLSADSRPELAQYSAAELAVVVEEAHARGRKVTAHAHARAGIANAVEAGVDSIEHCSWIGPHGRDYDPALVARMVRSGTFVDFTPAVSYRLVEGPREGWDALRARLRQVREIRLPTMMPMWRAGVAFSFGSDAGTPYTYFEDFPLVLEQSVLEAGLPADAVIAAATGTAARSLGISDETGTIEVGKAADLLLVQGNPLTDIRAIRRASRVYRSGRLVAQDGRVVVTERELTYVPPAVPVSPMSGGTERLS